MNFIFPIFRTNKADDIIKLLKLFKKEKLQADTRRQLAKSIQALAADLVAENWDMPMPPCKSAREVCRHNDGIQ